MHPTAFGPSRKPSSSGSPPTRAELLSAALLYARRGWPVFPLVSGGKRPVIPKCPDSEGLAGEQLAEHARNCSRDGHGVYDATTDPRRITAWWHRWPDANVAIAAGRGLLVLDMDPEKGGVEALDALEAEHEPLREPTYTVRTGGGGIHLYLRLPPGVEVRNSAGKLGPGLDVRSDGGYVVAPPSATVGPYTVLDDRPLAPAPEWLLKALREPERAVSGRGNADSPGPIVPGPGETIPEGRRNWTLYRYGCSLRAQGHDHAAILQALESANGSRCETPLDSPEVEKIARSASRHAPGNAAPEVPPEVLALLEEVRADWWHSEWRGMGERSARDVEHALLLLAAQHGRMIPAGVQVGAGYRALALIAAVGIGTVHRAIKRLKVRGKIRSDNANRRPREAGAFVLLRPPREAEHSTTRRESQEPRGASVPLLAPPSETPTAPRLRWSRPVFERVGDEVLRSTIRRLGKTCGTVVDHLERAGGNMLLADLADVLGVKRSRDLRRNTETYKGPVARLEEEAVVECSGDTVALAVDWLDALNCRREVDGEIADHHRDVADHKRQQDAYRAHLEALRRGERADRAPTTAEMDERWRKREARREASGTLSELERVSDSDPFGGLGELYALIDRRVTTVRGPGVLVQVFGDEARVVLDRDPTRWVPLAHAELRGAA
jgi:hypothetical protein